MLEDHGDGGSLVSAENKVLSYVGDHVGSFLVTCHPVLEVLLAETFGAGSDPYDDAVVCDSMAGIIESLLGLVHIYILREAACGYHNDISLVVELDRIEGIEELAALPVSFDLVAGEALDDLLLLVQDDINDEVDAEDLA